MKKEKIPDFPLKLPRRIQQECRALEAIVAEKFPQEIEHDEDMISFIMYEQILDRTGYEGKLIQDENGKWIINRGPITKPIIHYSAFQEKQLYNYYFMTGQYEKARRALYYASYIHYPFRDKDIFVLFNDTSLAAREYENMCHDKNSEHYWGSSNYFMYYPSMHQYGWFGEMLRLSEENLLQEFNKRREKIRQERTIVHWHDRLLTTFQVYPWYLEWLVARGDFDRAREAWQEYFDWYDWHTSQPTRPHYAVRGEYGIYEWQPVVGAINFWFKARENPERRLEYARKSLECFQQWFIRDHIVGDFRTMIDFPEDLFYSMLARLDLEVDLETCTQFARYFKPFFMAYPELWAKLEAMGVDYEPPRILPPDELDGLIERFKAREKERYDRHHQYIKETQPLLEQLLREERGR